MSASRQGSNGYSYNTYQINEQNSFPSGHGHQKQRLPPNNYNNDGIIKGIQDLERYIRNENRQLPMWDMEVLQKALKEIPWQNSNHFTQFINALKTLAAERKHFELSELEKKFRGNEVQLSRHDVAIILANAFLCRLNFADHETSLNFNGLYCSRGPYENKKEKLKCLIYYLLFILSNRKPNEQQYVHYKRVELSENDEKALWSKLYRKDIKLTNVTVIPNRSLSDAEGMAQVDFANRKVGGGVLSNGCLQEEIKFITCPELLLAKLFPNYMRDNEAIVVNQALQYINFSGYASSFKFQSLRDKPLHFGGPLIAIDATDYSRIKHHSDQFSFRHVQRELKKAYVGFNAVDSPAIATGNWGGGAFKGDPVLKFKIQWIAASLAGKELFYYPYSNDELKGKIEDVCEMFRGRHMSELRDSIIHARENLTLVPERKIATTHFPADYGSTSAYGHSKRNEQYHTSTIPVEADRNNLQLQHYNNKAQYMALMSNSIIQFLKGAIWNPYTLLAPIMGRAKEDTNNLRIFTTSSLQEKNVKNPSLICSNVMDIDSPMVEQVEVNWLLEESV